MAKENYKIFLEKLQVLHPEYSIIPGKTKYINNSTPIWLHCDVHDVDFQARPGNLLSGKAGCEKCYMKSKIESRRKTQENRFRSQIEEKFPGRFDFSKYRYISQTNPVTLICLECGEEFQITPELAKLYIRSSRDICPVERRGISEVKDYAREHNLGGEFLENVKKEYPGHTDLDYLFIYKSKLIWRNFFDYSKVKYKNNSTKIELIIKSSGKSVYQTPANNLQGFNPTFNGSLGEEIVGIWLLENNINHTRRNLLRDKPIEGRTPGSTVEIDFTLKVSGKEIWIEYNGEQHYRRSPKFCPTQEEYLGQLTRDENVRKYAKENNILLIEIPYTYNTYDDISGVLSKIIFQGESPEIIIQPKIERP